jgi:hypothetical protein
LEKIHKNKLSKLGLNKTWNGMEWKIEKDGMEWKM